MATREKLMNEQGLMWNGMPEGVNSIEEYEEYIKKKEM
jgi:glutathione S-transferase